MSACEISSQCGENWAEKRGLKLVRIDYTLPLLMKNFLVKNHASNIQDLTVSSMYSVGVGAWTE